LNNKHHEMFLYSYALTDISDFMKRLTTYIILITVMACSHDNDPADRYIKFLKQDHLSALDYLIYQWKTHDMVVLCERDHDELTQYQFLIDVFRTSYFIDSVGVVFTEVGPVNCAKNIEKYLRTNYKSDSLRKKDLIQLFRDNFWPAHEKYNYFYLLYETNKLNCTLPDDKHIIIRPVDEPSLSEVKNKHELIAFEDSCCMIDRDSTMAMEIINQFDQLITTGKRKCLVIQNFRHAFSRNMINDKEFDSLLVVNTGALLYEKYQNKVSFIMLNNLATTMVKVDSALSHKRMRYESIPIQKGLWDYSFEKLSIHDMGFDFNSSPFGEDSFDFWSASDNSYRYKDIFNGFIYYLPLDQHIIATGIPDYLSDGFDKELLSRFDIYNDVEGTSYTDSFLIDLFSFTTHPYKDINKFRKIILSNN